MRILFLCHRIPFPPDKGDKIRSWHEVDWLAARHEVDLFTLIDDEADRPHIETLRRHVHALECPTLDRWRSKFQVATALLTGRSLSAAHFLAPELTKAIHRAVHTVAYDLAFVFSSNMAPYLDGLSIPRALDFVDIDSAKFEAYAGSDPSLLRRLVYGTEAKRLRALEKRLSESAELTLVCSQREAEELRGFARPRRVEVVPNGTDTDYFAPRPDVPVATDSIVFTGAMDYRANIDAVLWFAEAILPLVQAELPTATFTIVGSNPTPEVLALHGTRKISVTGRVPDVRPYVQSAMVAVAPLRVARGIQNKVLEALACGTPVVATMAALGGLDAAHRTEGGTSSSGTSSSGSRGSSLPGAIPAESPREFAAATLALLRDRTRRDSLGITGRDHVVSEYRWERRLERLEQLLVETASSARRRNVEETVFRSNDR